MITLYHGTNVIFEHIELNLCSPYKDFGQAFYLTEVENDARKIANARVDIFGGKPIVNTYKFNEELLKDGSLSYKSFEGYTEEWADFIYKHRDETFVPPYKHDYDVVYGPIANDRVGLQIRYYRMGNIDKKEFIRRLKYMKGITFQFALCTNKAIEKLIRHEHK